MPMNFPAVSKPKYLLYSYYKALDYVQAQGLLPQRLFRVLYPLWRVRVQGQQKVATEFDELEWFLERGLQEMGLHSVTDLAAFFGLEFDFVQRLVDSARRIGHLRGENDRLELTDLGIESVRDRVRYDLQKSSVDLYFDGLGCSPLSPEHAKIPILDDISGMAKSPFQAFSQFGQEWRPEALSEFLADTSRHDFLLPGQVSTSGLLSPEPVYMPAYFVEAQENKPGSPLRLLAFSQVKGLRDTALEDAVNRNPTVFRALKAKTGSRPDEIRRYFEQSGLKKDAWYLNEKGPWGAQVMVDGQVFLPNGDSDEETPGRLALRSVGRYALIYDWCIWVMCDDAGIRKQAAIEQLLEWLQNVNVTPAQIEISTKFASICHRLSLPQPAYDQVLLFARQRGLGRAAARLEEMEEK